MLQTAEVSAFRSSLASGLDHFGYYRGLRQHDYHRANRILQEWVSLLFDANGVPVIGGVAIGFEGERADSVEQGDASMASAAGDVHEEVDQVADFEVAAEEVIEERPAEIPEVAAEEVIDLDEAPQSECGARSEDVPENLEGQEELATEQQESDRVCGDVSASRREQPEERHEGDVSESRGVAELFPPSMPMCPPLPAPIQQHIYNITLVTPSSSSSHPHPTRRSRSRSAPRQRLQGWCKQCKKQKSVCYKLGDWECPTCRCTNQKCQSKAETWCKSCRTFRSLCLKEGDWICQSCDNHNFAWREVGLAVRYSGFEIAAIVLSGSAGKVRARVERSYGWAHQTSMVQ